MFLIMNENLKARLSILKSKFTISNNFAVKYILIYFKMFTKLSDGLKSLDKSVSKPTTLVGPVYYSRITVEDIH